MIKIILKKIVPPIFVDIYYLLLKPAQKEPADLLFGGHDNLFKQAVMGVEVYGEYGSGQSTIWMFNNTSAAVLSVDTSEVWVEKVKSACANKGRLDIRWADLGEVGDWGRPTSYERRDQFSAYINSVWQRDQLPNVVLIDGRFRIACFLSSLLHANSGTYIVFDDYVSRKHYHVVEEFLCPLEKNSRQALFLVDESFDKKMVSEALDQFMYVMD